ncbi:MAG: hypothetical protein V4733_12685 [Verrucomicrobiota bacterium]
MRKKFLFLLVAVFALAAYSGWRIAEKPPVNIAVSHPNPATPPPSEILRKLEKANLDADKDPLILNQATIAEHREMADELLRRPHESITFQDTVRLGKIIASWTEKDRDDCRDWAENISNPASRESAIRHIIISASRRDPFYAAALIKKLPRNPDDEWDVPYQFIRNLGHHDADTVARIVAEFIDPAGETDTEELDFSFDFERALNKIAALNRQLKPGESFSFVPSNLLSEWAAKDPHAAWMWLTYNEDLPGNGAPEFFEGSARNEAPQKTAERIVSLLKRDGNPPAPLIVWQSLAKHPSKELVSQFLDQCPDRNLWLENMLVCALGYGGGNFHYPLLGCVLETMTAPERQRFLGKNWNGKRADAGTINTIKAMMKRMDFPPDDIPHMLPGAK